MNKSNFPVTIAPGVAGGAPQLSGISLTTASDDEKAAVINSSSGASIGALDWEYSHWSRIPYIDQRRAYGSQVKKCRAFNLADRVVVFSLRNDRSRVLQLGRGAAVEKRSDFGYDIGTVAGPT